MRATYDPASEQSQASSAVHTSELDISAIPSQVNAIPSNEQSALYIQTSPCFLLCFCLACSREYLFEHPHKDSVIAKEKRTDLRNYKYIAISAFQVALQVRQSAFLFPSVNKDERSLCLSTGGISCIVPLLSGFNI